MVDNNYPVFMTPGIDTTVSLMASLILASIFATTGFGIRSTMMKAVIHICGAAAAFAVFGVMVDLFIKSRDAFYDVPMLAIPGYASPGLIDFSYLGKMVPIYQDDLSQIKAVAKWVSLSVLLVF